MEVTLEKGESKGRYIARVAGKEDVAELTFSIANDHLIIADHTDVPDSLRGTGVGKALFLRMVEDARANNTKIIPLCPFVKSQFEKHPETRDVTKALPTGSAAHR